MPKERDAVTFDAVTLEVLWTRLISVVDEAAAALVRSSFSTLVRESHDFSCVLTDDRGYSTAQATRSIPSFIGTLPRTVRHFLDAFPVETIRPGDVFITNDIYQGTGHLPDITVAKPIFCRGKLVSFAASVAHAPDIGGKIRSPEAREVFEEGFQIPIMRLMREGKPDETLMALLRKNVRVPDQVTGDLLAQLTALDLMESRLLSLMDDYQLDSVRELSDEVQRRSERATRDAIAALPDGVYRHALQTDGLKVPIDLAIELRVRGDEITIDFDGTSPQVDRAINVAFCYTFAFTVYGVKCALCPTIPNNEGSMVPIHVRAPEGSILNPVFPSAGGSRLLVGHYLPILVFEALRQAIPEQVMANTGSPLWGMNQSGVRRGKPYVNMFFFNGGMGATYRQDGNSCLSWPSNVSSTSVEVMEQLAPLRVRHKKLRPDSGGAGAFRGGLGQDVLFESRSDSPIAVSFLAERTRFAAAGMAGGGAGAVGAVLINDEPVDPKRQYVLGIGDTVLLRTPGGGGFGPSEQRDPDHMARDRTAGYVTTKEEQP